MIALELARALIAAARSPLPPPIAYEAKRSLFNVLGVAVGGALHEGSDAIVAAAPRDPQVRVAIPGRSELVDPGTAAIATGFAAHVDDFDDTHLVTVIHPAAATFAAIVAAHALAPASGDAALRAFALGCEAQLRVGVAISPEHYDRGWHITGTCGVVGAAAAAALLLELEEEAFGHALALATTMTLGHREAFGTMTKPFHPGKAAANGVTAALLARAGVAGPLDAFEGNGGFAQVLTTRADLPSIVADFGTRWELASNTYKPYPCGIVAHPAIDAALAIASEAGGAEGVGAVTIRCHPLVPELMGNPDPSDGLQARFSAIHGASAAICDGAVGIAQYETERVRRADVAGVRAKTKLDADPGIARDEAFIRVERTDGRVLEAHIEHARGSLARPLTSDELRTKVRDLVTPVIGDASDSIEAAVNDIERAGSFDALLATLAPKAVARA